MRECDEETDGKQRNSEAGPSPSTVVLTGKYLAWHIWVVCGGCGGVSQMALGERTAYTDTVTVNEDDDATISIAF